MVNRTPKVLLVDDERLIREAYSKVVKGIGVEITALNSAVDLEQRIEKEHPDMLMLDILMPDRDGLEAIGSLKAQFPTLPIIAISGGGKARSLAAVELLDVARLMGADSILQKPISPEALQNSVRQTLHMS